MKRKRRVRKAKKVKRVHAVMADLRNFSLPKAKSALGLAVFAGKHRLGQLEIGRGGLYWWGHKRQRSKRISWSRFASMMNWEAYGVARI
jgi:hypothetical protein